MIETDKALSGERHVHFCLNGRQKKMLSNGRRRNLHRSTVIPLISSVYMNSFYMSKNILFAHGRI